KETPQSLQEKEFKNIAPITPGMFGYSMLRAKGVFGSNLKADVLLFGAPEGNFCKAVQILSIQILEPLTGAIKNEARPGYKLRAVFTLGERFLESPLDFQARKEHVVVVHKLVKDETHTIAAHREQLIRRSEQARQPRLKLHLSSGGKGQTMLTGEFADVLECDNGKGRVA
ncbi:MAG: hypothetical protein AAGE43_14200, partial [Pseudomonadota bacterium]